MELLHFKEDTAKPENRTNLALLGALQVKEIREHLTTTLGLQFDALIFPSPNLQLEEFTTAQRPDFVVRSPEGALLAYIEVELGPENGAQLTRYRASCNAPVFSLVGKESYRPKDLSLESLRKVARKVEGKYVGQQSHVSLELFCRLVEHYVIEGNFRTASTRAALSEEMRSSTLVQLLYERFGSDRILGVGSGACRGRLLLDTVSKGGLSVRVYSTETGRQGFSLVSKTSGRDYCEFPSKIKLHKYFPFDIAAADRFADLVAELGAKEVAHLSEHRRARLPIEVVETNFEALAEAISDLM